MIRRYHLNPDADWLGGARNSAKVVIAFRDLGLEHKVVLISRKRDMRNPDSDFCRQINPWGTVPVLDHDGFILRESAAILRYLAEITPGNDVWPAEPKSRALADQWLTWECSTLVPSLLQLVRLGRFDGVDGKTDRVGDAQRLFEEKSKLPGMTDAQARWRQNLDILNKQLATDLYVAGRYSVADIALGCAVPIGPLFGMSLVPYPNIVAWLKRLELRRAWQAERTFVLDMGSGRKGGLFPCTEAERLAIPDRRWAEP